MFSRGGQLFTRTEHFEELLNPTNTSSIEEAEFEDSGGALAISLVEVAKVVNKLLSGKVPGRILSTLRC